MSTRSLVPRVTCPHCWHPFEPCDALFVSSHEDLRGDPRLGPDEMLRFRPTRFDERNNALDLRDQPCRQLACPSCHLPFPHALLELPPLFLSVLGAPGCGKSFCLAALTWELDWGKGNDPSKRWGWAAWALVSAVDQAFLHGLELFAALALWRRRDKLWSDPAFAVQMLLGLLMFALCYRVAQSNGYLGDRHVLLVFLFGVFWMVAGIDLAVKKLPRPSLFAGALLLAVAGLGLVRTAQPLHADRAGFRQAGEWIAANTLPGDKVLDPYAHAYYHSRRVFTDGRTDLKRTTPDTCYVVLEKSSNDHPHLEHLVKHAKFLADRGEEVARIEMPRRKETVSIIVYKVRWTLERNVGG